MLLNCKASSKDFEPTTWAAGLCGRQCRAPELSGSLNTARFAARRIGEFFTRYDILLTSTLARPPVATCEVQAKAMRALAMKVLSSLNAAGLINAVSGIDALAEHVVGFIPYTPLFNVTGQPAMSVPLYWNDAGLSACKLPLRLRPKSPRQITMSSRGNSLFRTRPPRGGDGLR